MDDGLVVLVHRVGEVEPAVVHVLLFAVGQRLHLARLRELLPAFHLGEVEVGALLRAPVFLFSFIEGSALNAFSVKTQIVVFKLYCSTEGGNRTKPFVSGEGAGEKG